jgi:hypothetical protein
MPGLRLARLDGSAADEAPTLAPFGVSVFRLDTAPDPAGPAVPPAP